MKDKQNVRVNMMDKMLTIGIGLALVYWSLDSLIYFLISHDITYFQGLFGMDINGIARRMLAISFFMIFGSHAQHTITQRKQAEEALKKSEGRYRTILESIEKTVIMRLIPPATLLFLMNPCVKSSDT